MIAAQFVHDFRPGTTAAVQALCEPNEIRLDFFLEPQAVAPQLGRRVPQRMLIMEQEIEGIFANGILLRPHFEPPAQIAIEFRERHDGLFRRGTKPRLMHRRLRAKRGGELAD